VWRELDLDLLGLRYASWPGPAVSTGDDVMLISTLHSTRDRMLRDLETRQVRCDVMHRRLWTNEDGLHYLRSVG
jgi:hypothetical protein